MGIRSRCNAVAGNVFLSAKTQGSSNISMESKEKFFQGSNVLWSFTNAHLGSWKPQLVENEIRKFKGDKIRVRELRSVLEEAHPVKFVPIVKKNLPVVGFIITAAVVIISAMYIIYTNKSSLINKIYRRRRRSPPRYEPTSPTEEMVAEAERTYPVLEAY